MNATNSDTRTTRTICGYCGVGCSLDLVTRDNRIIAVHPAFDGPANQGALCVKGQFAYDYVHHPDRLTHPLVRDEAGQLQRATWDEALQRAAQGFMDVEQKAWTPRRLRRRLRPYAQRSQLHDAEIHPRGVRHKLYRQL